MKNKFEVPAEKLRYFCDPEQFKFDRTNGIEPAQEFVGQDRAIKAIEFGLSINKKGYNIFVTGLTGTGKMSVIKTYLQKLVEQKQKSGQSYNIFDWCYIHNFNSPDRPLVIKLEKGKGRVLRTQIEELLETIRVDIVKVFTGDEYIARRKQIIEEAQAAREQLFKDLDKEASQQGFMIQASKEGILILPLTKEGKTYNPEQYNILPEEVRIKIEEIRSKLSHRLEEVFEKSASFEKDFINKIKELDRKTAELIIHQPFETLLKEYEAVPEVKQYLADLKNITFQNIDHFKPQEAPKVPAVPLPERDPMMAFKVNVFVDNSEAGGPPIIIETNPTFGNMFGKIERRSFMGAYFSDHTMLKPGAVSLANGGYLIVNIRELLLNPGVWEGLKRVIKNNEGQIEDASEAFGMFAPLGLRPQPIPTEVKIIVTGDSLLYQLLSRLDEDFWEMFKIKADFDFQIERSQENMQAYASIISSICRQQPLCHFDRSGVAKIIEHGARVVADQEKLSSRFGRIVDLLFEAEQFARDEQSEAVSARHVNLALEARVYRSNLLSQRISELIKEGVLMIDTEGKEVGQVNGLSVYDLGDFSFGKPSRITARTFMGRRGVMNIERESEMSGRIHNKGVLILSGYLGWKYAQDKPLSLSATICFEQSYEGVEGDSASSAELYAILSSLANVPLNQGTAVTGSVNQKGEIQPIGGVNEKVEGFYDVCKEKGLTGKQGVIIPYTNIKNLMLREDVVDAVRKGLFRVWAIKKVDEGMELLTGKRAGVKKNGAYPRGSLNYLVDRRLKELAESLKNYFPEVVGQE